MFCLWVKFKNMDKFLWSQLWPNSPNYFFCLRGHSESLEFIKRAAGLSSFPLKSPEGCQPPRVGFEIRLTCLPPHLDLFNISNLYLQKPPKDNVGGGLNKKGTCKRLHVKVHSNPFNSLPYFHPGTHLYSLLTNLNKLTPTENNRVKVFSLIKTKSTDFFCLSLSTGRPLVLSGQSFKGRAL